MLQSDVHGFIVDSFLVDQIDRFVCVNVLLRGIWMYTDKNTAKNKNNAENERKDRKKKYTKQIELEKEKDKNDHRTTHFN